MHEIVELTNDMKWHVDKIEYVMKDAMNFEEKEKQGRKYQVDKMAGRNTLQDYR